MCYIYIGCGLLQGSEVVISCKLLAWHSFKEIIITKLISGSIPKIVLNPFMLAVNLIPGAFLFARILNMA